MSRRLSSATWLDSADLAAAFFAIVGAGGFLAKAAGGPNWLSIAIAAIGFAGAIACMALKLLYVLAKRHEREDPELLERSRAWLLSAVVRERVGDGGQLGKMVRHGAAIDVRFAISEHDSGRPRVRDGNRLLPWSEIRHQWDISQGRLVILGEPGYGKTVLALTLVKHINARKERGAAVAELFSLAEWQRWHGEHPGTPFADWLVEQLTISYRPLSVQFARELVAARLVLPILDGLDEIATVEHRRACVDAIDAYAERSEPHRPFVLTCRAREYDELGADWMRAAEHVELAGLQPDQIQQALYEWTAGRPGWGVLRERQAAGEARINELFASPLRLAIALQVYRDRDPGELLKLIGAQAHERLWELLLETHADTYPGATAAQVRAWLRFLAAGMQRSYHQRFMLHELYLISPDPTSARRFGWIVRLAFGLISVLVGGLISGLVYGFAYGLTVAFFGSYLTIGFAFISNPLAFRSKGELADGQPITRARLGWRARAKHAAASRPPLVSVVRFVLFVGSSARWSARFPPRRPTG